MLIRYFKKYTTYESWSWPSITISKNSICKKVEQEKMQWISLRHGIVNNTYFLLSLGISWDSYKHMFF